MSLVAQSMARGEPPDFSRPPVATGDGAQVKISFAVSAAAAVEVAIVDGDGKVNVYTPEGKLKQEGVITHVPNGASGIAVDRQGNIFVGPNIKPTEQPYPPDFQPILPPHGWVWWRKPQPEPWNRT
jgi:hypothetical protein